MRRLALVAMAIGVFTGCAVLEDVADGVEPPEAVLNRVDLVEAPTAMDLVAFECEALFGALTCDTAGLPAAPKQSDLFYRFDLVFDLSNPNAEIPIPLVEALVGMTVFDVANLGSVCISFCDPEDETCEPSANATDACTVDESQQVDGPEDLIPTVDDLVDLARDGLDGNLDFDNDAWRVIGGGESMEAHLQFDLAAAVMLDLADLLLEDAVDDVLAGRPLKVEVPYTTEGTVFFDVPELGRHGIGFGPWDDSWVLK